MSNAFNVRGRSASIKTIRDNLGDEPSQNFGERRISMTFNMPEDWHRRFKIAAAARGMSMKEMLVELFDQYEAGRRQD